MTAPTTDAETVTELLPEAKQLPLRGLYLNQGLAQIAVRMQTSLVLTNYLTDKNGVIAKADEHYDFHVPAETKNASDWRLSQELMAQADVIIGGGDYLRHASVPGSHPQDILYPFEPHGEFEELGDWRLRAGYEKRSPDLAVVTRHLDFKMPKDVLSGGRRVAVFTTYEMADSVQAEAMRASGAVVLGTGEAGVDGNQMIDYLTREMGAHVIVMTSGPGVLQLLLQAGRLDLLYITQVQREIWFADPSSVKVLVPDGDIGENLKGFQLTHRYLQERAVAADGSTVSQSFMRYDRM